MVTKAVKINKELYDEIVRLIKKSEFKYKYNSISAYINEAVYERLKEGKHHINLFKIKI